MEVDFRFLKVLRSMYTLKLEENKATNLVSGAWSGRAGILSVTAMTMPIATGTEGRIDNDDDAAAVQ